MAINIKSKVILLAIVPCLLMATVISAITWYVLQNLAAQEVAHTQHRLLEERKLALKHYQEIGEAAIKPIYDASAPGDMAARDKALEILKHLLYDKASYFFGYDSSYKRVFWADKNIDIGKSFADAKDANGVYVIRGLVDNAKDGSHYLRYDWTVPGSSKPIPKLGYTSYLPKWDLAFGTQVNLDDIDVEVAKVAATTQSRIDNIILLIVAVILGSLVVVAVVGTILGRGLVKPLLVIKENLDDIAAGEGDLTRRLPERSQDELGALARSFNRFVEKIHGLVRQITEMTGQLNNLVGDMADQAQRSEAAMNRQRHETDQVATAIHEMSAAASEVSTSAQGAATAARESSDVGKGAKQVVSRSIDSIHLLIGEISDSSQSLDKLNNDVQAIASVVEVIRSIADQTNLLALNAAIEAARAGDAGRGFAVVADEVRALASRTQQSTQEIQQMIDSLQQGTQQAVVTMGRSSETGQSTGVLANEAGQSLDAIAQLIETINDMNAQIASASEEQHAVAEEISRSMTQIAREVDSVADDAKGAAGTAKGLSGVTERLGNLVRQFRI
ncbi:methyl-accepting chemotaxis protein [Gallaecimonas pentaromativorans]|uniref:methyl-accepting chemotaxis protein n=1 Tax=Gallaecimonas pentaromativorans TaxID=584787 RepID=UPI003A93786E